MAGHGNPPSAEVITDPAMTLLWTLLPVVVAVLGAFLQFYRTWRERKKSDQAIATAESKLEKDPKLAKPAWDLARITLEAYFNRNLNQINQIFWLSVFVMIVGFTILIFGVYQAMTASSDAIPAPLTVGAGLITEFIGATFLFIYRSTLQQATTYSKTLERINSVGMAMQILETMPNEVLEFDLRNKTKAKLVEMLVSQSLGCQNGNHIEKEDSR